MFPRQLFLWKLQKPVIYSFLCIYIFIIYFYSALYELGDELLGQVGTIQNPQTSSYSTSEVILSSWNIEKFMFHLCLDDPTPSPGEWVAVGKGSGPWHRGPRLKRKGEGIFAWGGCSLCYLSSYSATAWPVAFLVFRLHPACFLQGLLPFLG